jgi:uncharacterized protein
VARDLKARLGRLKQYQRAGLSAGQGAPAATSHTPARPVVPVRAGSGGLVDWVAGAPLVFTRRTQVAVSGLKGAGMESRLLGRHVAFGELCFMDTETTGLSGGAGTTVFLVGSARYSHGVITVVQTLLGDFPGEPEFLRVVHEQLWAPGTWVSYNGKVFDSRLIQTRFLLNAREVTLPEQLDLLYWSRRLWRKKIGRCSLGDIEREILGVVRTNDVAGIEIPDLYFDFLKTGDASGLLPVFAHHLEDIVSLVKLYFHIESMLELVERPDADVSSLDRVGLGRYLVLQGAAGGDTLLRGAIANPLPAESLYDRERAATALAREFRRCDRGAEAADLWERLWADGSVPAGIELAKHLEHRVKDLQSAVLLVENLLERSDDEQLTNRLDHRLRRLRRKLES